MKDERRRHLPIVTTVHQTTFLPPCRMRLINHDFSPEPMGQQVATHRMGIVPPSCRISDNTSS